MRIAEPKCRFQPYLFQSEFIFSKIRNKVKEGEIIIKIKQKI